MELDHCQYVIEQSDEGVEEHDSCEDDWEESSGLILAEGARMAVELVAAAHPDGIGDVRGGQKGGVGRWVAEQKCWAISLDFAIC